MAELSSQSDRGAAIIASAIIEEHLKSALQKRIVQVSPKVEKNLFGVRGHLSGFQAKIDLGLALGLYNKNAHHDLDVIRRIRNQFAHYPVPRSFADKDIGDLCARLLLVSDASLTDEQRQPRNRFLVASLVAASLLYFLSRAPIKIRQVAQDFPTLNEQITNTIFNAPPNERT